jgi:dTDP-4-dehydrorhamnose reductase
MSPVEPGSGSPSDTCWLVTGANGQLGRSLCAVTREEGIATVGVDLDEFDVTDGEQVSEAVERFRPSVLVNCAAFTHVDRCEEEPQEAQRTNADAPGLLAEASCKTGCLLVQLSTDYVFSGQASRPILEDAPADPRSTYGRTKWAGEEAVRRSGCEHLIVRSQWIFGPGANFVRAIYQAAVRGESLRVVEDQIGRPTWSRALARGILHSVRAGARGPLHLACEGVASWFDLAVASIEEAAGRGWIPPVGVEAVATDAVPRPAPRPTYSVLGLARARRLGVRMPHWRTALSMYLDSEEWSDA